MHTSTCFFKILKIQSKGTTYISSPNMFAFPIFRKRHENMKKKNQQNYGSSMEDEGQAEILHLFLLPHIIHNNKGDEQRF